MCDWLPATCGPSIPGWSKQQADGICGWWAGGNLAGQFADAGLLDEIIVSIAPVTLGSGKPLLPRRLDLRLAETSRNRAFVCARYQVLGRLREDR